MKIAINDPYIERLIQDPKYEIRGDGTIWTTICRTGKQSLTGKWRQLSFVVAKSGHLSVKYQRKHLYVHRVIYRAHFEQTMQSITLMAISGIILHQILS